jgi:hypothetical protein
VQREYVEYIDQVARSVPADGRPSRRTGQSFNCKVWLDDVLFELHSVNVIQLTKGICKSRGIWESRRLQVAKILPDDIEFDAHSCATSVETGRRRPMIVTETYASMS